MVLPEERYDSELNYIVSYILSQQLMQQQPVIYCPTHGLVHMINSTCLHVYIRQYQSRMSLVLCHFIAQIMLCATYMFILLLQCTACGMVFMKLSNLYRHQRVVHLKIRAFCDLCGKSYSRMDKVQQHKKYFHKIWWHFVPNEVIILFAAGLFSN